MFLAEHSGELVGVVRLAREHETLVLRGMRVHSRLQRQGIGRRLLETLGREIGDERCYCIPFRWLVGFYGEIGFQEIEVTDVPPFLAQRCAGYLEKGQNVVVMRREGRTMR
ncbi:MAG: GNAT family N-acetyltransferase [Vicinamibacterales bacterium]